MIPDARLLALGHEVGLHIQGAVQQALSEDRNGEGQHLKTRGGSEGVEGVHVGDGGAHEEVAQRLVHLMTVVAHLIATRVQHRDLPGDPQ